MFTAASKSISKWLLALISNVEQSENRVYALKLAAYAAKVVLRRTKPDRRTMAAILSRRALFKKIIPHMLLEVCSLCQHKCAYCAHGDLIDIDKSYQLSMEELRKFISCTRESGYFIENLWIHGPGEPTLWTHFNEGVLLLHGSGVVGSISIETNGQSLGRISDAAWACVAFLSVSFYPSSNKRNIKEIMSKRAKFGFLVKIMDITSFRVFPQKAFANSLPALCKCPGPMIYGNRLFSDCGPPVFQAARILGLDIIHNRQYCSELGLDYLAQVETNKLYGIYPKLRNNLELCKYCWANWRIPLGNVRHSMTRGPAAGI